MPQVLASRAARLVPTLVALALAIAAAGGLAAAAPAQATTCGASTVAPAQLHSPDGSTRPFYGDFARGSTKHSGYVGYELRGAPGVLGSDVWIKLSNFTGGSVRLAAHQSAAIPVRATSESGKPVVYAYLTASSETSAAQSWTLEIWNGKPGQAGSTQVCAATDGFSKVIDVISASANKIESIAVSTSSPAIGGSFKVTAVGDTGTMGSGDASEQVGGNGVFSMAPAMDDSWPADSFSLTGVSVTIGGTTTKDKLRIYPGTSAAGAYTVVYAFTVRRAASGATPIYPVQNIASGTQVKYTGTYPSTVASIAQPAVRTTLLKSTQSLAGPPYLVTYQVTVSNTSTSQVVLDYLRDTPTSSSPWSFASGSAKLDGASIADPANDAGALVFSGPFTVPAAAGANPGTRVFTYGLSIAGSVSNAVVGQVGDVVLGGGNAGDNEVAVDPSRPVITTSSLPPATTGIAYSETLTASGGTGSYTWALTTGALPAGMSLASSTGEISGTPTTPGSFSFTATVTDAAGATGNRSFTITVADPTSRDTTAPQGSLTINGGAASTGSRTVTLDLAATDAVGVTRYRVAEGSDCSSASWVEISPTTSYTGSAVLVLSGGEGAKTVCAQYDDAAGNVSTTYTASIVFDTPPTLALASSAPDPTNAAFTVTATFSQPVTGFALADVTVGNGTASNLQGSRASYTFDVTPSAQGAVTVDVGAGAATDAEGTGNIAASRLTRTYDSVRPAVALSSGAPDPTNRAFAVTLTFSESVSGLTLGDISVTNGGASNLRGSGAVYTFDVEPAAEGTVAVALPANAATDAAGNGNLAAPPLERRYAPVGPTVTLTKHPDSATTDTAASFGFAADMDATFTCSLDDGPFEACTSPFVVSGLAPGEHRFLVRARSATGAIGSTSFSWRILALPDLVFTLTPPADSLPDVAVGWRSGTEGVSFTCSLDSAAFTPCASSVILSDLDEGAHTFTVRATAPNGAVRSAAVTWTVRRRPARPPADVTIIPKISPTDMLGRPQTFRETQDRARSKGPFTRRLSVKLRVPTPANLESNVVYISNYDDFRDQRVFPIANDELYDWELRRGRSGDRIVYIRFSDEPDAAVGAATIVLDQELPRLTPAFLGIGPKLPGRRLAAAASAPKCGGPRRRWLFIGGRDGFSGLNAVQIASDPDHPCSWRPFLRSFSYRLRGRVIYVRIEDRVGNISKWYRVVTPR